MQSTKSTKYTKQDVRDILSQWQLFTIADEALHCTLGTDDRPKHPCKELEFFASSKNCKCGDKARCFFASEKDGSSAKQRVDGALTAAFTSQYEKDRGLLIGVFEAFVHPAEGLLRAYAEHAGLRYGDDVLLAFKGGNILRILLQSLAQEADMKTACQDWAEVLGLGDLDFEVYVRDAQPARMKDVMVLMAVALASARDWLCKNLPTWELTKEQHATVVEALGLDAKATIAVLTSTPQSDSVVKPFPGRGGPCTCESLYMPVPRVLRQRRNHAAGQQHVGPKRVLWWGQTKEADPRPQPTIYPMSHLNRTLNQVYDGIVDADLLRVKRNAKLVLGECTRVAQAEVLDVSVSGNDDVKHALMKASPTSEWFQQIWYDRGSDKDGKGWFYAPSLRSFFEDLRITLFVTNDRPWDAIRYEKRVVRWVWVAAMLCLTDSSTHPTIADVGKAFVAASKTKAKTKATDSPPPLARLLEQLAQLKAKCDKKAEQKAMTAFDGLVKRTIAKVGESLTGAKGDVVVDLKKLQQQAHLVQDCRPA